MRSLSSEMATSSAAASIVAAREKCSRNKRKFRQDPPFHSNQGSSDEPNSSCGSENSNASASSEGESNWKPESTITRSAEAVPSSKTSSNTGIDSSNSRNGSDGDGTISSKSNSASNNGKSEMTASSRSFQHDQVKLMRFRSGQAARAGKALSAGSGAAGCDGKQLPEESAAAGAQGRNGEDGNKASEDGSNEFYETEEEEWDDAESEFEDLLVKNLGSIYDEAINKIVASGHSAEEALAAVLKHGRCCGGKDPVSNIVENCLAYLTGKRQPYTAATTPASDDNGSSGPGDHRIFSDLTELHKHSLAQMVGLLREVRPSLSKGEAMWCLLMSDMNVPMACVMDDFALPPHVTKEQQPPNPSHASNDHLLTGQAGARGSSTLPSTTTAQPLDNAIAPTSSAPLNSSNSPPPRSMHPPSTSSAAAFSTPSPPPSVLPLPPISPSPAATTPPPQTPSSLSTTPDVLRLSRLDSAPHSSVSSRGLKPDETSSNSEELSATEEGTPKEITNCAEAGAVDCVSSGVDYDDNEGEHDQEQEQEQEQDEKGEGLTSCGAAMPAIASSKVDERVDQEEHQGSIPESEKNENIPQQQSSAEPSSQVTDDDDDDDDVPIEIKKLEVNLDSSESNQQASSDSERLQVSELPATTDGVLPSAEKQSENCSVGASQPADCETKTTTATSGMIASQENNSSISLQLPEATCLAAEPPKEAPSCPPAVKFGTVDEPAAETAAEALPLSNLSSGQCDGESTTTSTSGDGTVITRETLQAFLQAAQKTDAASEERVVKDNSTATSVLSPEAAPAECISSRNETTTSVSGKGQVEDQKEEMIMKLVHRSKELEAQLQERTEWAKQRVMQAARKLSNDLQELKELRRERDEALRLKKDKQSSEDSTVKKLTESENELRKAKSQLDEANKSVKKLDAENAEIRAELQAAKLSAAETQSSCHDMATREKKSIKRAQAWEKHKAQLQEALSEEKRKIVALQQQLALAKERQQQAEVRWRQEEKAKEDAVLRADHERRAREQAETAAKKREESLRRKAESNYQRHRDDIQRLESEISQFRTSAEAAQLATSRWGPGVAVTPHMMELSSLQALKESNNRLAREIAELQDMSRRDVHRERECVMCMCEEMSVVFLPCAHQVVCVKCNDLHEKQGMRDCPSCRTPIKQRIRVYGVST